MSSEKTLELPLTDKQKTRDTEIERLRLVMNVICQATFAIDNIIGTDEACLLLGKAYSLLGDRRKALLRETVEVDNS